jgi:hypothetical protein
MDNARKRIEARQVAPFIMLMTVIVLVGLACGGGTTSPNDGGGTGGGAAGTSGTGGAAGAKGTGGAAGAKGTGGAAGAKGTGGAAGAKGTGGAAGASAGTGGQGGSGISTACETCAASNCSAQILACAGASACQMCVMGDYNVCLTNNNAQYLAVCACAKTPCAACASYCP